MDFRKQLVDDYEIVFGGSNETEHRGVTDTGFAEKWGWFGVMYRLTNGEIVNLDRITKLPLKECLTWLCYETDLNLNRQVNLENNGTKQDIQ